MQHLSVDRDEVVCDKQDTEMQAHKNMDLLKKGKREFPRPAWLRTFFVLNEIVARSINEREEGVGRGCDCRNGGNDEGSLS